MNLSAFEEKFIRVKGFLLPKDSFFTDIKLIKIIRESEKQKLSLQKHRKFAEHISKQLQNTKEDDLINFERFYKRLTNECFDTEQAKESYWRLTNMYLDAFDPPNCSVFVRLFEETIIRYINAHYKRRLFFAYEKMDSVLKL